jgi:hypothetical protein
LLTALLLLVLKHNPSCFTSSPVHVYKKKFAF